MHPEIRGHPSLPAESHAGAFRITVCAECEALRTVLFLSKDRWYCTRCRAEGDARPTVIPLHRPQRT